MCFASRGMPSFEKKKNRYPLYRKMVGMAMSHPASETAVARATSALARSAPHWDTSCQDHRVFDDLRQDRSGQRHERQSSQRRRENAETQRKTGIVCQKVYCSVFSVSLLLCVKRRRLVAANGCAGTLPRNVAQRRVAMALRVCRSSGGRVRLRSRRSAFGPRRPGGGCMSAHPRRT